MAAKFKEKKLDGNAIEVEHKYRQGGTTIPQSQPNQQGSAVNAGFTSDQSSKRKFWILMTDKQSVKDVP